MGKRLVALFALCITCLAVVMFRVYYVSAGTPLAEAAARQSSYRLDVGEKRGNIYDCRLEALVNQGEHYMAAVLPTPETLEVMARQSQAQEDRQRLLDMMETGKPFLTPVDQEEILCPGVEVFTVKERYAQAIAPHVVGYVDGSGAGKSGIESSYDQLLRQWGGTYGIRYETDAAGRALSSVPTLVGDPRPATGGVVLTLDARIQGAAQAAMKAGVDRGACVVMDVQTGDIKAMVSQPDFDQNRVADYLTSQEAPLLNRTLRAYNVGSTFKLVVAAAALEKGIPYDRAYECTGKVEIGDVEFNCHKLEGHGWMTMEEAVKHSCNTYFIQLGQETGAAAIRTMAAQMGFGNACQLAPDIFSQPGVLTPLEDLAGGELANFSFGQGKLTATPVQIASMVSAIANGGQAVTPRLVEGTTDDGLTLSQTFPAYATSPVMSPTTAAILQEFMVATVEVGSGINAQPISGGAGGKTASAQTGRMDETGEEIVHAWFAGFCPADQPRYAMVVMAEGGDSGGNVAAPVFKAVADVLSGLDEEG